MTVFAVDTKKKIAKSDVDRIQEVDTSELISSKWS